VQLPRRSFYLLVLGLATMSILLRYPLGEQHEAGADTTFIHSLATSVSREGRALWILHPFSFFGLYALSYPSAIPFLAAGFSELSGVGIEGTFWIMSLAFGVLGPLGMILLGRSISSDDRFVFFLAAVMALSPFYIKDTTWVGASRGFVVALVPFALFLSVRLIRRPSFKMLLLLLLLVVLMSAIHRMGVLSILILVCALFVLPFHKVTQALRFALVKHETKFRIGILVMATVGFVGVFFLQFQFPGMAGADVREQFGTGAYFSGESFEVLVLNMGVSFVGKVGLLFPVASVGVILYSWKRPKEAHDKFVLLAILVFLPLLSMRDYITEFIIPLIAVPIAFAAMAAVQTKLRARRTAAATVTVVLLLSAGAYAWIMKDYWSNRYETDAAIPDSTYATALYIRYYVLGATTNHGLTGGRVTAISERPSLPLGGASLHWYSSQQLIFRYVDGSDVRVAARDLFSMTFNTDDLYEPINVRNAEVDWETIMYGRLRDSGVERLLMRYEIHFLVIDRGVTPFSFRSYGIDRGSPFVVDVSLERYTVFSGDAEVIYFLG